MDAMLAQISAPVPATVGDELRSFSHFRWNLWFPCAVFVRKFPQCRLRKNAAIGSKKGDFLCEISSFRFGCPRLLSENTSTGQSTAQTAAFPSTAAGKAAWLRMTFWRDVFFLCDLELAERRCARYKCDGALAAAQLPGIASISASAPCGFWVTGSVFAVGAALSGELPHFRTFRHTLADCLIIMAMP